MYRNSDLARFLDELDNPPQNIAPLLQENKWVICRKGYGTPELEIKYMHNVFRFIQKEHPQMTSFSWGQSNDYNDSSYEIDLFPIIINDELDFETDIEFDIYEKKEIDPVFTFFSRTRRDADDEEYIASLPLNIRKRPFSDRNISNYWAFQKRKYSHLQQPCLKMMVFLKLLQMNFSMYYFLYAFGNGNMVRFTEEGVTVRKFEEDEAWGMELGEGLDIKEMGWEPTDPSDDN